MDLKLASVSQKRAVKLTNSMNSSLSAFLPLVCVLILVLLLSGEDLKWKIELKFVDDQADEIAGLLSELAEVVVQEKFLLQEFNDMFHTMCLLQVTICSFSYSF